MKISRCFFSLCFLGLFFPGLTAAEATKATPAVSPLAPLAWLVDGVWIGTLSPGADGIATQIETRFNWTENKQAVRFDSAFVRGEKRSPYTSGLYAWDPAGKKITILYVDSGGNLTEGIVALEGEVLAHELVSKEADGTTELVRARLTKSGDNGYTNAIFLQKAGAWVKLVEVRYERKK